jgi:hypothetical protein
MRIFPASRAPRNSPAGSVALGSPRLGNYPRVVEEAAMSDFKGTAFSVSPLESAAGSGQTAPQAPQCNRADGFAPVNLYETLSILLQFVVFVAAVATVIIYYRQLKEMQGAVVRYYLDDRKQRLEFAMKLHEEWWKEDFRKARTTIYEIVEDMKRVGGPGPKYLELLNHCRNKTGTNDPAHQAFACLAFFFADLNTYLEKGLVDTDLAYRLFGAAQYAWFEPLFDKIRPEIEDQRVRWAWETKSLSKRFKAIANEDDAALLRRQSK